MKNPIADHWDHIKRDVGDVFCCDSCREKFRVVYFAGAMAAFSHATNWDPEAPQVLFITAVGIAEVREELTEVYLQNESTIATLSGAVRH